MPRVIKLEDKQECSLEEAVEEVASLRFDPQCDESSRAAALWLKRLNNNRSFLGDLLVEQLKQRHKDAGIDSGYGPQAIVLSPLRENVFFRANIWPSPRDLCFNTSGARSFVYGIPHDHNFSFLTSGYLGPGYASDYYEYDYGNVAGFVGENAGLKFVERSVLRQGKVLLYRAHHDIHSQIPPAELSVSLNIMHVDPAQQWFDQYGFDLERGEVAKVLSPNSTEAFLRIAVASASEEALDVAQWVGASHPSDRLRLASFEARAGLCENDVELDQLWREAELSGRRMLREVAFHKRCEITGM